MKPNESKANRNITNQNKSKRNQIKQKPKQS